MFCVFLYLFHVAAGDPRVLLWIMFENFILRNHLLPNFRSFICLFYLIIPTETHLTMIQIYAVTMTFFLGQ